MRFGDGYSQRAPAGLNADLKTYSVTLSVSREEATALESFLAEHGEQKASRCTFSGRHSARQALAGNSHHQSALS